MPFADSKPTFVTKKKENEKQNLMHSNILRQNKNENSYLAWNVRNIKIYSLHIQKEKGFFLPPHFQFSYYSGSKPFFVQTKNGSAWLYAHGLYKSP